MDRRRFLALFSAVLSLGAAGCCCLKNNLINTGDGFDVYGSLQFTGEVQPPAELLVAVVAPCGKHEYLFDSNTVAEDAVSGGWHYAVIVPAGDFELLVFADRNGDGTVQRQDLVGRAKVHIAKEVADPAGMMPGPTIEVDLSHPTDVGYDISLREHDVPMLWPALSDPFFDPKWGLRGLIWPRWVLRHTDDSFLFSLGTEKGDSPPQRYRMALLSSFLAKRIDKSKIQVLFVHGVEDTPRGFSTLSDLDPARFQRWFFFYPSGLSLAQMGANLAGVIEALSSRADTILVAHSMGGLVSRQAIKLLASSGTGSFPLKGYLSLATPYGGMDSANGMNNIPAALRPFVKRQALFDVQPESPFLSEVHQGAWPDGLPFYLFWGNFHARGDDGTVRRESATDPRAASHAARVCSYDESHAGMLGAGTEPAAALLRTDFKAALGAIANGTAAPECSVAGSSQR